MNNIGDYTSVELVLIYLGNGINGLVKLDSCLDSQLKLIEYSRDGSNGRYVISSTSLKNSIKYIEKSERQHLEIPTNDEISSFLICVSAILKIENDGVINNGNLTENPNIIYIDGIIHGFEGDIPKFHLNVNKLKILFEMFKLEQMTRTSSLVNCTREYNEYLGRIDKNIQLLYIIPINNIPYILLKNNKHNFYELPLDDDAEHFHDSLIRRGLIIVHDNWHFDGSSVKASILITNNNIYDVINSRHVVDGMLLVA